MSTLLTDVVRPSRLRDFCAFKQRLRDGVTAHNLYASSLYAFVAWLEIGVEIAIIRIFPRSSDLTRAHTITTEPRSSSCLGVVRTRRSPFS